MQVTSLKGYILGKLQKKILNKNTFLKHRLRNAPSQKKKKAKTKKLFNDCSGSSSPDCLFFFVLPTKYSRRLMPDRWLNQEGWMSVWMLDPYFLFRTILSLWPHRMGDVLPEAGQRWTQSPMEVVVCNCINTCRRFVLEVCSGNPHGHREINSKSLNRKH